MEYIKGECLDTTKKLIKYLATEGPYLFQRSDGAYQVKLINEINYFGFSALMIANGNYFQAIPKPEPRKLYAFKDTVDGHVRHYTSDCPNFKSSAIKWERNPEYDITLDKEKS